MFFNYVLFILGFAYILLSIRGFLKKEEFLEKSEKIKEDDIGLAELLIFLFMALIFTLELSFISLSDLSGKLIFILISNQMVKFLYLHYITISIIKNGYKPNLSQSITNSLVRLSTIIVWGFVCYEMIGLV